MALPCTFDDLKKRTGPPLNAWGLWGKDNELGQLNLITPETVKRGRDAIQHGVRVNLNLPLSDRGVRSLNPSVRPQTVHEIVFRGHCMDDRVEFNTQNSSQWDGFRHFPYRNYPKDGEYTYYGGMTTDQAKDKCCIKYGVQNLSDNPITGRAHLLDIPRWLEKNGRPKLKPFSRDTPITLEMLQGCAADQGNKFEVGDILIVRSGLTEELMALTEEEHNAMLKAAKGWVGVDQGEDVLRWHWENGFAAVAGDTFAYEAYPFQPGQLTCHEAFLAGWGLPIGELFDLRKLSAECARLNQYTFFLASMAMNMDAGIASPPNAQAIL